MDLEVLCRTDSNSTYLSVVRLFLNGNKSEECVVSCAFCQGSFLGSIHFKNMCTNTETVSYCSKYVVLTFLYFVIGYGYVSFN